MKYRCIFSFNYNPVRRRYFSLRKNKEETEGLVKKLVELMRFASINRVLFLIMQDSTAAGNLGNTRTGNEHKKQHQLTYIPAIGYLEPTFSQDVLLIIPEPGRVSG